MGLRKPSFIHDVFDVRCRDQTAGLGTPFPQAIQLELVQFNRANAQKNLIFTGELLRLLDVFTQNGIQSLPSRDPSWQSRYMETYRSRSSAISMLSSTRRTCAKPIAPGVA
jgi:hypothetical protein